MIHPISIDLSSALKLGLRLWLRYRVRVRIRGALWRVTVLRLGLGLEGLCGGLRF